MLGGVLAADAVGQAVAPLDALQPVDLHEEGERGVDVAVTVVWVGDFAPVADAA